MLSLCDKGDLEDQLRASLARLAQEVPLIYDVDPAGLQQALAELEGEIPEISQSLLLCYDRLFPNEVEVDLRSSRLGLTGRLDRIVPGPQPSLIRTGKAPQDGVWKRDRMMLAGYALLLGEKNGTKINRGLIEYPLSGAMREVQIYEVDKARVLRIRDRIRQIKNGRLPDRPTDAPCDKCEMVDSCETNRQLASKFF
jgi:CRISPR-associated exonuclease Cas4